MLEPSNFHIKVALAIKTVLVFFPLTIIHRPAAHLSLINDARAKALGLTLSISRASFT